MPDNSKATINKESQYELPFDIWDSDMACTLFEFYLYNMATVDISPLSYDLQLKLNNGQKQYLLQRMLDVVTCTEADFIYGTFLNNKLEDIVEHKLDDDSFTCDQVKGFIQSPNNDFSFDILMKRIRNSFAHERITRSSDHKYMILEDKKEATNSTDCTKKDTLRLWRDIIVNYQNNTRDEKDVPHAI